MKNNLVLLEQNNLVTYITLNRPEKHNAFNEELIEELIRIFEIVADDQSRAMMLRANGKNFSAGADLDWMRKSANNSPEENLQDAKKLALLFKALTNIPKPTIALVQGAVLGGGIGLVAACDIVLASRTASFCFSEVKFGLIPSTIAPYVINCIGPRVAQYYFLTAQPFNADQALKMNLIHRVVNEKSLEDEGLEEVKKIIFNAPNALASAKKLIQRFSRYDEIMLEDTAKWIAEIRSSEEGKEGINAFLEKRKAKWVEV